MSHGTDEVDGRCDDDWLAERRRLAEVRGRIEALARALVLFTLAFVIWLVLTR